MIKQLLCGIALSLVSLQSSAALMVYTDEASWLAALSGSSVLTEDFEATPLGVLPDGTTDVGLFSIAIDTATVGFGIPAIEEPGFVNGSREFHGYRCGNPANCDTFQNDFLFDALVLGFAADWDSTTTGAILTVEINGTTVSFGDYLGATSGDGFLGFVDPAGFTVARFGVLNGPPADAEDYAVDNVRIATGNGVSVPVPASLYLVGLALAGLGWWGHKKT